LRAEYFQAVYNYNLGLAKLDHVAGQDVAVIQPLLPRRANVGIERDMYVQSLQMGGCGSTAERSVARQHPSRVQAGEREEKVRETIDAVLVLQDTSMQGQEHTEKRQKNAPGGVSALWV
jgi:hypothetical protein